MSIGSCVLVRTGPDNATTTEWVFEDPSAAFCPSSHSATTHSASHNLELVAQTLESVKHTRLAIEAMLAGKPAQLKAIHSVFNSKGPVYELTLNESLVINPVELQSYTFSVPNTVWEESFCIVVQTSTRLSTGIKICGTEVKAQVGCWTELSLSHPCTVREHLAGACIVELLQEWVDELKARQVATVTIEVDMSAQRQADNMAASSIVEGAVLSICLVRKVDHEYMQVIKSLPCTVDVTNVGDDKTTVTTAQLRFTEGTSSHTFVYEFPYHSQRSLQIRMEEQHIPREHLHLPLANAVWYVSNRTAGVAPASRNIMDWSAQHATQLSNIYLHPQHAKRRQGDIITVSVKAPVGTAFQLSFIEYETLQSTPLKLPYEQYVLDSEGNELCWLTGTSTWRFGENMPAQQFGSISTTALSAAAGCMLLLIVCSADRSLSNRDLCVLGSFVDLYPLHEAHQWQFRTNQDGGSQGQLNSTTGAFDPTMQEHDWYQFREALGEAHQPENIVCGLVLGPDELGYDNDKFHFTVEMELAAQQQTSFDVEVTGYLINEAILLSPAARKLKQLFDRMYCDINGNAASTAGRSRIGVMDQKEFTYGEVEFLPFRSLLELAKPKPGSVFYDLGCGTAKPVVLAAMLFPFSMCNGIELIADLFDSAVSACGQLTAGEACDIQVVEKAGRANWRRKWQVHQNRCTAVGIQAQSIQLFQASFLEMDWAEADLVYTSSICFPPVIMQALTERAEQMKPGAKIITLRKLESDKFKVVHQSALRMSWGRNSVYIMERKID